MLTGIIETVGIVKKIESRDTNIVFWIASSISDELQPDQSVSHNGTCITIEEAGDGQHWVTAIEETLFKTKLGRIQPGDSINLERCLPLSERLGGQLVQSHLDTSAICTSITDKNGSWEHQFTFDAKFAGLIIEKG
jgi:riboflavin synthase